MKKRIQALFMALVMVLSSIFVSVSDIQVVEADEGITVRFHYQRTDGDYTDWNMWAPETVQQMSLQELMILVHTWIMQPKQEHLNWATLSD